jgi:hypothetical protein
MAAITKQLMPSLVGPGSVTSGGLVRNTPTMTTLSASDTFVYEPGADQYLFLRNSTGGSIAVTLDGDAVTTMPVDGYGTRNLSAGYVITVAAGASFLVPLDTIAGYLSGTVALTGGANLTAAVFSYH